MLDNFIFGTLMINTNQFMIAGSQSTSGGYLHYYKFTYGNTNADWADKMLCPSGVWDISFSEQLLNFDSSKIYSLISYGTTSSPYIYFVTFNIADGTVSGSRYRSSGSQSVAGAILSGDYSKTLCVVSS